MLAEAKPPRGAWILDQLASEEAAKFLMLLDAASCPRELLKGHLVRRFYDHLTRAIYVAACHWKPGSFREFRSYVERERQSHYLDGPNGLDWIYRNSSREAFFAAASAAKRTTGSRVDEYTQIASQKYSLVRLTVFRSNRPNSLSKNGTSDLRKRFYFSLRSEQRMAGVCHGSNVLMYAPLT